MPEYTIMAYNIEHMNKMFKKNIIKENMKKRAQKIAKIIKKINPHILGICEAASSPKEHEYFIKNYLSGLNYKLAHGISRGIQNLVFYYKDPFQVKKIDEAISFYNSWNKDIDNDKLKERYNWDRKPLEIIFQIGSTGPKLRIILAHTKSKGVFSVTDFHNFQKISLANRKRLVGQALKLRERIDKLLKEPNPIPIILMGDLNDGPGLDPYEKMIGSSFVETVMGSVYYPNGIFHNALWYMTKDSKLKKKLWTADFPDPIVNNPMKYNHRVWIDHILLSQDMLKTDNKIRYITKSGKIGPKEKVSDSNRASDHFAVYCKIKTD